MANQVQTTTAGFALAAYMLSLSSLAELLKQNQLTASEMSAVVARARVLARQSMAFPQVPGALSFADHVLELAETMIAAGGAQKPSSGAH